MKAKAEAKANEFLQKSINGEVIELEKLKVQRAAIEKWDGKMPTVSGRVTPFINIGQKLGE